MNNIKKIGLTALAGSLALVNVAQAGELSVSGVAKATYVNESSNDVTGQPFGFDQTVQFAGSADSDMGTVSTYVNYNGSGVSSSSFTIDMGDNGKFAIDNGTGAFGVGTIKDMTPRASGAEQIWDDTDNDAYFVGAATAGALGYSNTIAGWNLTVDYAKNGGGFSGDDGNTDAGAGSDRSFAISGAIADGFTVGYGHGDINESAGKDVNHNTAFAKYAMGPVTLGTQMSEITASGNDSLSTQYAIAINVNENMSVSYGYRTTELGDGTGGLSDPEDNGVAVSYTSGNMTIGAFHNKADNVGGSASAEDDVSQITLSFAF